MQNRYLYIFCLLTAIMDLAFVNISIFAAFIIGTPIHMQSNYRDFTIIVSLIWLICGHVVELYQKKNAQKRPFMINTLKCICLHLIFILVYINILNGIFITGRFILIFYSMLIMLILTSRSTAFFLSAYLKNKFKMRSPIALLGINPTTIELANYFKAHDRLYDFAGFLNDVNPAAETLNGTQTALWQEQIKVAAKTGINEVLVSLAPESFGEITSLIQEANKQCVRLRLVIDFSRMLNGSLNTKQLRDLTMIRLTMAYPQEEMHNRFIKRLFDIIFSSLVLLLIFSWLYPIIAVLIKLESRGPVIFKQNRSGRDNESFWCYKFRSMCQNVDAHDRQASRNDDRITRTGRFLRRTSLDEFPQFINVLIGNMSVVGPRPHMLKHTAHYRTVIDNYMVRHYLKPGITGWAQVNGLRGETIQLDAMERRVKHDIWYLENWSVYLDIKITIMTISQVLRGHDNAY